MYTKKAMHFFSHDTMYYKDGRLIAIRDENGLRLLEEAKPASGGFIRITRSQAFRYWEKHFPEAYCWSLPPVLCDLTTTTEARAFADVFPGGRYDVYNLDRSLV